MLTGDPKQGLLDLASVTCHTAMEMGADSITIIMTHTSGGFTQRVTRGEGNYYARRDAAREWLVQQEEIDRDHVRAKPDDDCETL